MKNIHLLPTDKPSRLHLIEDFLMITNEYKNSACDTEANIYITSDEVIRDDDWVYCPVLKKPVFICLDSILMFKNLDYDSNGNSKYKKEWLKKIILTTDPDLIKDGVQPIDDEFLEWFVKNPSCESVHVYNQTQVGYEYDGYHFILEEPFIEYTNTNDCTSMIYNPKEETAEEAAERFYPMSKGGSIWNPSEDDCIKANKQEGFIEGTKWQAERMYSEAFEFAEWCDDMGYIQVKNSFWKSSNDKKEKTTVELFEEFKNK